ncbi:hypothetical protein Leryth_015105 [Lithospermum erythrorhizon]|nr:hypothetical protein Leryth_015105 [Lithospermum erythrorhizon]
MSRMSIGIWSEPGSNKEAFASVLLERSQVSTLRYEPMQKQSKEASMVNKKHETELPTEMKGRNYIRPTSPSSVSAKRVEQK